MRSRRKPALELGTGIAVVLMALAAADARAADDPFALDTPSSALEEVADEAPFHASATLDGRPLDRLLRIRVADGRIAIARESMGLLGLAEVSGDYADLADLGLTATIDWSRRHLDLVDRRHAIGRNRTDASAAPRFDNSRITPLTAMIVDYDITASSGPRGAALGGLLSARLVRGSRAVDSSWILGAGPTRTARLDTVLRIDDPAAARSIAIGDIVTSAGPGARAVRLGGLRIGSDFALQPGLVTYPLPDFAGAVAVPQTIDLLMGDRRLLRTGVDAGGFSLADVPVPAGRGHIGAVVRDALGRERLVTLDFYASRNLLAAGLDAWSVSVGALRRRYGRASFEYRGAAASLAWRRGIDDRLTVGVSAEASERLLLAGGEAAATIGGLAEAEISLRASRASSPAGSREGAALGLTVASRGRGFGAGVQARWVTPGYRDLASAGGDPPPPTFIAVNATFNIGSTAAIAFTFARERDASPRPGAPEHSAHTAATANLSAAIGPLNLFAEASLRHAGGRSRGAAFVGVSLPLGRRAVASASITAGHAGTAFTAAIDRPAVLPGETGYAIRARSGRAAALGARLEASRDWGRVEGEAELVRGSITGRVTARGSVVVADGTVFPVRPSSGGMLLVSTGGVAGITLARDHRAVGTPSRPSRRPIVVTDMIPNTAMRVGILPGTLPVHAAADSHEAVVAVPDRSVSRLDLGIRAYVPRVLRLLDPSGLPFAPGTRAIARPSGRETMVGLDGLVEINAAGGDHSLSIVHPDGGTCAADLVDVTGSDGALRCTSRVRPLPMAAR